MPNKYKRTVGSRPYKNYSEHTLKRCLLAVKTKQMTQREAEKAFKIPRRTIINKLKAHHVQPVGRPTVFTEQEENNFVGNIHVMSEYGFPIDKTDLKFIIKSYLDRNGRHVKFFKNNLPGRTWTDNFIERHKTLSVRLASNIKRSRASVNAETLTEYINNLKITLSDVYPQNIYNYDETNLTDNPGQKKVLVKRGSKYPERICNTSKVSISLMICGNAVVDILPPYVVYKAKGLWENWTEHGPKGCRYNATTSGWFDANIFTDWFNITLLRHLKKKTGKKVVIGDNLSSHLTPEVNEKCKENDISSASWQNLQSRKN
ncbi:uncharacterized protein LOC132937424 [Metopolophium dirhodum]|uniref:uncharacterized protein LOC132937424 n=1 Tax=Metopolophium dirhodum TaxID=44670 RepID=UPI00298F4AAE|nr:uncharacterized protein LOC132937424 [Metopolophium dirhodum]